MLTLTPTSTPASLPAFFSPRLIGLLLALGSALLLPFSPLAALVLLPAAAMAATRSPRMHAVWPSGLILVWLLWLPLSLFWSLAPGLSIDFLGGLLCLPLAWIWGMTNRDSLKRWLEVLLPWSLLGLVLWGWHQGPETYTTKPQGPFNDPNTYAAVLNLLALPLLASYLALDIRAVHPLRRTGMLALLGVTGLVAMLVSSRGATLALSLVAPLLFWHGRHGPDFSRKLGVLAVVSVVAYLSALVVTKDLWAGKAVVNRLAETVQHGDQSRLDLMHSAWLMIQEHPWLGSGLGTFRLLYAQFRMPGELGTAGGWVHNDYLQLWQEAGLPMFVILLGVVLWLGRSVLSTVRAPAIDLPRLGYLAGLVAVLLHALVNFLFYFSFVSLLVGLYLAIAADPSPQRLATRQTSRAGRMVIAGYTLILAYLFLGQVAIKALLIENPYTRRVFEVFDVPYQKYEMAYWLSVLAPFHPTPHMVMAKEAADVALLTGDHGGEITRDAAQRYIQASRLAVCYMPITTAYLELMTRARPADRQHTAHELNAALACNPHHGLTYYYAGMLAQDVSSGEASRYWITGLAKSRHLVERIMLAAVILSRAMPEKRSELSAIATDAARAIQAMESSPMLKPDQRFWTEAQYKLYVLAGDRYLALVPPPGHHGTRLIRHEAAASAP